MGSDLDVKLMFLRGAETHQKIHLWLHFKASPSDFIGNFIRIERELGYWNSEHGSSTLATCLEACIQGLVLLEAISYLAYQKENYLKILWVTQYPAQSNFTFAELSCCALNQWFTSAITRIHVSWHLFQFDQHQVLHQRNFWQQKLHLEGLNEVILNEGLSYRLFLLG